MKKHQIKSGWYYLFWGLATVSVVIGQISVVLTYNRLSENLEFIIIEQAREKSTKTAY